MASANMDYETENGVRGYDDDGAKYQDRERSASPRPRRGDSPNLRGSDSRRRSASPNGNGNGYTNDRGPPKGGRGNDQDDGAVNPGSNLFVTGIHPKLTETEVSRLFEKYGEVEKCQIMLDPHTKESRGFGFVKLVTAEQADAAKEGLQGEVIEGRTLSIEKARRSRPRTPTPGKYFGPPKREDERGGHGRFDRYDDRRRGGGGYGGGGREGGYGGYRDHRDDRDRGYGRRDDYRGDRYAADRYSSRPGDDRRGGGYSDRYDRDGGRSSRDAPQAGYGDPAPRGEGRESYGGRFYDDDRYSRR